MGGACDRIDSQPFHGREVNEESAVAHRLAGDAVATATHRDTSRSCVRAKVTAVMTSAAPVQHTISAGRLSIIAFQNLRAAL